METLQYRAATAPPRADRQGLSAGFSLLEVLVAITILAVGLTAMAGLVAQSLSGTERARFLALATTLASEKLEDLSRWPTPIPPAGAAPQITAGGSLSTDTTVGRLNYYDDVDLSNTTGEVAESSATASGFSTIEHFATGVVTVNPTATAAVASGTGTVVFHRRWLIEANPTVNGVTLTNSRRITVIVTRTGQTGSNAISFQMSTLRP